MLIGRVVETITMKTITAEGPVIGVIDVDRDDMHRKMALMRQDTMVLQVAVMGSETGYLEIVVSFI